MGSLRVHLATAASYAAAIEGMMDGATTLYELHEESGLAVNTLRKLVMCLRRRKIVHIAAWEQDAQGKHCVPAYALSRNKSDVSRPPRMTMKQRSDRYNEKIRHLAAMRGTPVRRTRVKTL